MGEWTDIIQNISIIFLAIAIVFTNRRV